LGSTELSVLSRVHTSVNCVHPGSWILPSIRFSDYLETLRHYLKDHGFIPSFQWPYANKSASP
jgi:hypothetical protein